jgi:isopentenyldiphosphate isomerase
MKGETATEEFDVLDCAGRKTGERIARNDAHRTGAWHGAFHCLIVYEREGRGYALFQKRSHEKLIAPDRFDVSAGGHYAAGEGPEAAGPREITEELGLDVKFGDLISLGKRVFVYCFTPGIREHELQDVYLLPRTVRPGTLALQAGEVDAVLELEIETGIELHSGKKSAVEGTLFRTGKAGETVAVATEDFVPCLDNYYLKLLLIARRYLNGEQEGLAI